MVKRSKNKLRIIQVIEYEHLEIVQQYINIFYKA